MKKLICLTLICLFLTSINVCAEELSAGENESVVRNFNVMIEYPDDRNKYDFIMSYHGDGHYNILLFIANVKDGTVVKTVPFNRDCLIYGINEQDLSILYLDVLSETSTKLDIIDEKSISFSYNPETSIATISIDEITVATLYYYMDNDTNTPLFNFGQCIQVLFLLTQYWAS